MKNISIIFLFALFLLISSCKDNGTNPIPIVNYNYMPLQVGNEWIYDWKSNWGMAGYGAWNDSGYAKLTITRVDSNIYSDYKNKIYTFVLREKGSKDTTEKIVSTFYISNYNGRIDRWDTLSGAYYTIVYDNNNKEKPWGYFLKSTPLNCDVYDFSIEKDSTLITTAGTFLCLNRHSYLYLYSTSSSWVAFEYFDKNIGFISGQYTFDNTMLVAWNYKNYILTSYTLK
jgi:hypothetical protein